MHAHDENYPRIIELWFLFSLIWSICATVDEDSRKKMDNFLRELEGQFPAKVGIQCSTLTFLFTSSWASGYEKLLVHLKYI